MASSAQLSFIFRFDYGEKFWVIKHKHFTCCCGTEKCRYNKASIQGFLKEYYCRLGEPLPDDVRAFSSKVKEVNRDESKSEKETKASNVQNKEGDNVKKQTEETAKKDEDSSDTAQKPELLKESEIKKEKREREKSPTNSVSSHSDETTKERRSLGRTRRAKKSEEASGMK